MPRSRTPKVLVHCKNCDKSMLVSVARINEGRGRFCSRTCLGSYTFTGRKKPPRTPEHTEKHRLAMIGKTPWNKKPMITIVYAICGTSFIVENRRGNTAKFCSRKCMGLAKKLVTGTTHPLWTRVERHCELCGKAVMVKPAKLHEFRFCS
jgi:endogenous inhibitor of DNA gyrase (YacG/DUF329 family)